MDKQHMSMVHTFNKVFKATYISQTTDVEKLVKFRVGLIEEEYDELMEAVRVLNYTEVVDALMDMRYVILGAMDTLGIELDDSITYSRYDIINFKSFGYEIISQDYNRLLSHVSNWINYLEIPLELAFKLVHTNNMTKICSSEAEALDTCKWLIESNKCMDPIIQFDEIGWIVIRGDNGKVCKSVYYKPVDLTQISMNQSKLTFLI